MCIRDSILTPVYETVWMVVIYTSMQIDTATIRPKSRVATNSRNANAPAGGPILKGAGRRTVSYTHLSSSKVLFRLRN